jgi:alpha-1,2-mannosyltransferase
VAKWLMTGASVAALAVTVSLTLRQLGWHGGRRLGAVLLFSGTALWLEPVQRAIHLGQIELILMALVVWDLGQPSARWWRGAGIGLAAGIKLVPLIFLPYLLLTRKFREAAIAMAALAATMVTGFLALPHASRQWWLTGYFMNAGRTGGVASLANQSLRGMLTRLAGSVAAGAPGSLIISVLVAVIGLLGAALLYQSGKPVHGWVLCALTGLLVSPISWDHHWVWVVPLLLLLVDGALTARQVRRWMLWAAAGALAIVYLDWPWTVPGAGVAPRGVLPMVYGPGEHPYGQLYHWHGTELIFGNAYVLAGLIVFVVMLAAAVLTRPAPSFPADGSRPDDPVMPVQPPAGPSSPELVRH